ncbi:MAG: ferredoxin [Acidobacteriota bacterium]
MSDASAKVPENEPGRYYVDSQCIDCDVCRDVAPDNFIRNAKDGYSFVVKQPENRIEEELCREALTSCPVDAIGDDGQ